MAYFYRRINTDTGMEEAVGTISMKTYDEARFEVEAEGGATIFNLSGYATLTADTHVIVSRNGQELNEGGFLDFTKDIVNNRIVLNYSAPKGSSIKVRVYGEKPDEAAFVVTADAGITELSLNGYMNLAQKNSLEVLRNGQVLNEGGSNDYTRDTTNNKLLFNYVVAKKSIIKVRA